MKETNIQRETMMEASNLGCRLFRNNVGMGWVGKVIHIRRAGKIQVSIGDVVIKNARPLHAGLCEGSSDLIGWTPITVTKDMVGQTVAIFTGLEIKTKSGKISSAQTNFIRQVNKSGGIAGIARSAAEAQEFINARFGCDQTQAQAQSLCKPDRHS